MLKLGGGGDIVRHLWLECVFVGEEDVFYQGCVRVFPGPVVPAVDLIYNFGIECVETGYEITVAIKVHAAEEFAGGQGGCFYSGGVSDLLFRQHYIVYYACLMECEEYVSGYAYGDVIESGDLVAGHGGAVAEEVAEYRSCDHECEFAVIVLRDFADIAEEIECEDVLHGVCEDAAEE